MTFEELLKKYPNEWGIIGSEYIIKVLEEENEILRIYIRPYNRNGSTLNFYVVRNKLIPIKTKNTKLT
jgi:hypothetical protein